tara:strand:- start:1887 stop:2588 length:702 start_codon:yes stop_codon:yes gene_type:complete
MKLVLAEYQEVYEPWNADDEAQEIHREAMRAALGWCLDTRLAEGVRRLFLPSDGIDPRQLRIDAEMILDHQGQCFPLTVLPLFRLHEKFGDHLDPVRFASIYRMAWQEYVEDFDPDFRVPDTVSVEDHRQMSRTKLNLLCAGGLVPLEDLILSDPDGSETAFYKELPNRFEVFRGSHHDDPARIAAGLGWTLDPEVAASYGNVVKACVWKGEIAAAFRRFEEIVVLPETFEVA